MRSTLNNHDHLHVLGLTNHLHRQMPLVQQGSRDSLDWDESTACFNSLATRGEHVVPIARSI